jgi:hypothetical protein
MSELHVVCVKWGNKYISQYANVLKSMVSRHLTKPFKFHCITEDSTGLDPDINVIDLPNEAGIKTWWSKLYMFSPKLPIKGTILYFDLDIIIFKNIDCLVDHEPGKFMIIRDFNRCRVKDWKICNSSVMRWDTGTSDFFWNEYAQDPHSIMGRMHGDQDWITARGKGHTNFFPDEWIRSYKWEMIGRKDTKIVKGVKKMFQHPPTIFDENRVAVFHGEPKPFNCGDEFVVEHWK